MYSPYKSAVAHWYMMLITLNNIQFGNVLLNLILMPTFDLCITCRW
jgi:hypothetical protein